MDLRKHKKLPARTRRVPKALMPSGIQVRYRAFLVAIVARAHGLVRERLYPRLGDLLGEGDRADAHTDATPRSVNRVMQAVTEAFDRAYPQRRLEKMAEQIAAQTSKHQKAELQKQIKSALGVDLRTAADKGIGTLTRQFVAENVALIKTIPRAYFADVESHVLDAMRAGERHETLAATLEDRLGVAEDRAALIARDQVLSFQADLNQTRQKGLGIERFKWRCSNDERVREAHAERDFETGDPPGQIFEWDEGPGDASDPGDGEFPGDGINCRCYADPVVDDLLGDE